jgi:hypothetical protein
MNRTTVQSSNIRSIGYDMENETLEIQFNDGSIYHYFEVPLYEYDGIMEASSHGKYLAQHIKDSYRYERIN